MIARRFEHFFLFFLLVDLNHIQNLLYIEKEQFNMFKISQNLKRIQYNFMSYINDVFLKFRPI